MSTGNPNMNVNIHHKPVNSSRLYKKSGHVTEVPKYIRGRLYFSAVILTSNMAGFTAVM